MNTLVFFDVKGYFFRNRVVVAEQIAEYFFHGSRIIMHLWLGETIGAKFKFLIKKFFNGKLYITNDTIALFI